MRIGQLQKAVRDRYTQQGYSHEPMTVALGIAEEAGEVARAVNNANPRFKSRKPSEEEDTIEHELCDLAVYIFALANGQGINLEELLAAKVEGWELDRSGVVLTCEDLARLEIYSLDDCCAFCHGEWQDGYGQPMKRGVYGVTIMGCCGSIVIDEEKIEEALRPD